jgi:hypothetical protein
MQIAHWFKRKVSAATRALTVMMPLPHGSGMKPNYESIAREGYMTNSVGLVLPFLVFIPLIDGNRIIIQEERPTVASRSPLVRLMSLESPNISCGLVLQMRRSTLPVFFGTVLRGCAHWLDKLPRYRSGLSAILQRYSTLP